MFVEPLLNVYPLLNNDLFPQLSGSLFAFLLTICLNQLLCLFGIPSSLLASRGREQPKGNTSDIHSIRTLSLKVFLALRSVTVRSSPAKQAIFSLNNFFDLCCCQWTRESHRGELQGSGCCCKRGDYQSMQEQPGHCQPGPDPMDLPAGGHGWVYNSCVCAGEDIPAREQQLSVLFSSVWLLI